MKLIDLSQTIDERVKEPFPTKIERLRHGPGAEYLCKIMPQLIKNMPEASQAYRGTSKKGLTKKSFLNGEFLSEEKVSMSVHTGTHLDSPYHFGSKSQGKAAKQIEDIPLEWCFSNGVVLDIKNKKAGDAISVEDLKKALKKINYKIKKFDIVLLNTGADKYWGRPEYNTKFCGVSKDATEWLVRQGVKIIGIDSLGFDRPFGIMISDYLATKDKNKLWPSHMFGRKKEYCHIERLANLDKIPKKHGFKVACFPIKIRDVGAAWTRVVAIL